MANKKTSRFEYRNKRGWINRTLEKVDDVAENAAFRGQAMTDSAKRKLYEHGAVGQAEVLEAPSREFHDYTEETHGSWTIRVELPGEEPYETKVVQHMTRYEYEQLQPGALVEVRVDPKKKKKRVLMVTPDYGEVGFTMLDASQIVAQGKRATGTVAQTADTGKKAPETEDRYFMMNLDLRSDAEPEPWRVQIGQRVPNGAEDLIADGSELQVAYMAVDKGDSVAVDWSASSDGKFT